MNPNQPHHTGQFQPTPPQGQWQQPNTSIVAAATKQKTGMPIMGAYALAALLGVAAIAIAMMGRSTDTGSANGPDEAYANRTVCAQIKTVGPLSNAAAASWNGASTGGNKGQQSDALAAFGTATMMLKTAADGASPGVREEVEKWIEVVPKWIAGSATGDEMGAATKKVESAACK